MKRVQNEGWYQRTDRTVTAWSCALASLRFIALKWNRAATLAVLLTVARVSKLLDTGCCVLTQIKYNTSVLSLFIVISKTTNLDKLCTSDILINTATQIFTFPPQVHLSSAAAQWLRNTVRTKQQHEAFLRWHYFTHHTDHINEQRQVQWTVVPDECS